MGSRQGPKVYSVAAHRGFADALVAGLIPRYSNDEFGLAKTTLLLPSARAARTVTEAFVRHYGESGEGGMLMPRMVMVGDLDLDESLGPLLDPLGQSDIPPAAEPTQRWLELSRHVAAAFAETQREVPPAPTLFRLAREMGAMLDRLNAEEIEPADLLKDTVKDRFPDVATHWQEGLWLYAKVQAHWNDSLAHLGAIDASQRRNLLFDRAAQRWKAQPPPTPIIAAGVTSAAPALARLLRVVSDLPQGAVILPDLALENSLGEDAWDELGVAGQPDEQDGLLFGASDAVTHPQYHLKLLLGRMGVNRKEVEPWHRSGMGAAPPARSHAIASLFLPPKASQSWADLPAEKRQLSGVKVMELPAIEDEAQSVALLIRKALEEPEKRVALITPDRTLARRLVAHLKRWEINADDSAGLALNLTAAGRFFLQLSEIVAEQSAPVSLISALSHPLVKQDDMRGPWLSALRKFDEELRGPRPAAGLGPLASVAKKAGVSDWWDSVQPHIGTLLGLADQEECDFGAALAEVVKVAEALAGDAIWAKQDGRALSGFVEDLQLHLAQNPALIAPADLALIMSDAMADVAVRPPYGGHPRVAIYGLLESRMTRADLVICAGLNEGTWPRIPAPDPLLAPPILRALGVPGADFRIGLAAHDLAGALGAPEVVLSRSARDMDGPTIPSRFLLRVKALLGNLDKKGDLDARYREEQAPQLARALDEAERTPKYERPKPDPSASLRNVAIKVTALDRLLGDPFQFYAGEILKLKELEALDADVGPAWQGSLVHDILDAWHKSGQKGGPDALITLADKHMVAENISPLLWNLWRPRVQQSLEWAAGQIAADKPGRKVLASEIDGEMHVQGVKIYGRADRIDRLEDGSLAIVDYKTGTPPKAKQTEAGYALQLGILGLIAGDGGFKGIIGDATAFEYWTLKKKPGSDQFGDVVTPVKTGNKRSGLEPEDFLPHHRDKLDLAISKYIKGSEPFTARLNPDYEGYSTYDQLMRLDEWERDLGDPESAESAA